MLYKNLKNRIISSEKNSLLEQMVNAMMHLFHAIFE